MSRIRSALARLMILRHSSNIRIRTAWWTVLVFLIALIWIYPVSQQIFLGFWITWNIFYTMAALAWSVFHLRTILRCREEGMRWAVWLTLFATLIMFSQLYVKSLQWQGSIMSESNITSALILVITLILCPFLFLMTVSIGWVGGAIGAFSARGRNDFNETAKGVVRAIYMALALLGLGEVLSHSSRVSYWLGILTFSLPLLTVGFYRFTSANSPARIKLDHWLRWLGRALQFHFVWRSKVRIADTRGPLAGLLAAGIILAAPADLISPFKTLGLVTLIQARVAGTYFNSFIGGPLDTKLTASRKQIVILDLDSDTRRTLLQPTPGNAPKRDAYSEARLQSEIIQRLHDWGAQYIVLPAPILRSKYYMPIAGQPGPADDDIQRTRSDIYSLSKTMQKAGNVILTLPPNRDTSQGFSIHEKAPDSHDLSDSRLKKLISAAHAVSVSDPAWSSTVRLPIIPVSWQRYVPVPVLLCAALTGRTGGILPTSRQFDLSSLTGSSLPQISRDGVLINFVGQGPQRDFPHVSYSTLIQNLPIAVEEKKPGEDSGATYRWVKPENYFGGRIVFLDSLSRTLYPTPIGAIRRAELMAYGTSTLLSGASIRRYNPISNLIWTVLIGFYIGASCFRRSPIDAIWRATIPVFLVILFSLLIFMMQDIWFDPVQPLGAALIAFGLATQFTFTRERAETAKERAEKHRTRAMFQRFVAPQMVDELLSRSEDTLGLGGKRQTVSVLFADVRNFTRFTENHEADKVIEVINIYMGALTEELHRFDGVLDKYTGDGLMAWFPVGSDPSSDVGNSVEAAIAMRDAALKVSDKMPAGERLDIGIGLHYGDAVVGLVGCEDLQVNWTALGHTVVISARLQTIAAGGEVVISEQVYAAIAGRFQVTESDPVMVKGLSHPVRPYRVTGRKISALPAAPSELTESAIVKVKSL